MFFEDLAEFFLNPFKDQKSSENNLVHQVYKNQFYDSSESVLRIVLNDHISNFETMLRNMNKITINPRNIQTLMIEFFKIKYDLAPPIMDFTLIRITICYDFRNHFQNN